MYERDRDLRRGRIVLERTRRTYVFTARCAGCDEAMQVVTGRGYDDAVRQVRRAGWHVDAGIVRCPECVRDRGIVSVG